MPNARRGRKYRAGRNKKGGASGPVSTTTVDPAELTHLRSTNRRTKEQRHADRAAGIGQHGYATARSLGLSPRDVLKANPLLTKEEALLVSRDLIRKARADGRQPPDDHTPPPRKGRSETQRAARNEPGLCLCGCGARTPIATKTYTRKGHVKGEHLRYLPGHNPRLKKGEGIEGMPLDARVVSVEVARMTAENAERADQLFREHSEYVLAYVRSLNVKFHDCADDVLQSTFLELCESIGRIVNAGAERAYLTQIATRNFLDEKKAAKTRRKTVKRIKRTFPRNGGHRRRAS